MCESVVDRNSLIEYVEGSMENADVLERLQTTTYPMVLLALQPNGRLEGRFSHKATCGIICNSAHETSQQVLPDMFGNDSDDNGDGPLGLLDDTDVSCSDRGDKDEAQKDDEDDHDKSSDSSSHDSDGDDVVDGVDGAEGADGRHWKTVAKQLIKNNLASHVKVGCAKGIVYAVRLPQPILWELWNQTAFGT